ncbi:Zn-dependent exopeptidase [Trichodelitschia bisporula]|uniref:Peptide hydrolase n=1 Tax=Trichodelitschia bisporula TaxID=703511 RepID=A0A6G1HKB4_9PEZI|nr:Zn-dependent exopeptidase [Trichodelitschia bisporula]
MILSKPILLAATAAALRTPFQVPIDSTAGSGTDVGDINGKLPLVDSEKLQALIKGDALLARAEKLYAIAQLSEDEYNHPTRVIGSEGHIGTIEYIYSSLAALGNYYKLSNQSFPAVSGNVFESRLVLGHSVPATAQPMGLTPATANKEPVYGPLVLVADDGCDAVDYPSSVAGAIALIQRGTCPFGTKSALAGQAGARAAVVYNNEPGGVSGTLGTPSPDHIATFGVSSEEAAPFIDALKSGESVDAIAYIDAEVVSISTTNVIAQTAGGDQDNCVMLGAHSDSVEAGPGINDDGSGSLTLLEVAKQLTKFGVKNCVRFAWWAGEEEGLLGSDYYVAQLPAKENVKIRLFMDYDMLGSPNYAFQVYDARDKVNPKGSQALRDLYTSWYERRGLNWTYIPFDGRSDYDGFIRNGIPGGGIATGAEGIKTDEEEKAFGGRAGDWYDPCYHQLCDDVGNVNVTAWVINSRLVAHSVATYAVSLEDFPERKLEEVRSAMAETGWKYHGHKLVV